jgi:hypothetical protein
MDFRRLAKAMATVDSRPEADIHLAVAVHRVGLAAVEYSAQPGTLSPSDAQELADIHARLDRLRRRAVRQAA